MNFPENLKYTNDHEWVRIEGDHAYIGITEFAQGELGDIVYVEIDTKGEELAQEELFGSVEAVKTVSDLLMPISGKLIEVNPDLQSNPEVVNKDPYGEGWMIKVAIKDANELNALMTAAAYKVLIGH